MAGRVASDGERGVKKLPEDKIAGGSKGRTKLT
jgi:hypothetical protein